ncbi:dihydrofolate reductase family protein [Pseudarthrobacter sp. J1738]|uniref:dihydrofolate reductase family protein n=1 Tax=Pseudarthrobacter sp. J1738 TaxID=3420446 RepID=UPI003D2E1FC7
MPRLRAHSLATSLDGYMAGPEQSLEAPLGIGTENLHAWVFETSFGRGMMGQEGGTTGIDDQWLRRGEENIGATIMGRNMFTPYRGAWDTPESKTWDGWWGPTPPYGHPVFVLTHHARDPLPMEGGTTFYFVTEGIQSAYDQAMEAAAGKDVRLGGGAETVREYLNAGLLDELHVATVPVILGGGASLFDGVDTTALELAEFATSEKVAHSLFVRKS